MKITCAGVWLIKILCVFAIFHADGLSGAQHTHTFTTLRHLPTFSLTYNHVFGVCARLLLSMCVYAANVMRTVEKTSTKVVLCVCHLK